MTEEKPEWEAGKDVDIIDKTPGDMVHIWMVARRRALIAELREIEGLLGLPPSIPQRERSR